MADLLTAHLPDSWHGRRIDPDFRHMVRLSNAYAHGRLDGEHPEEALAIMERFYHKPVPPEQLPDAYGCMKIIDENGAAIENPDLTLGYLTGSTEEITHPAVEGVEEQWHWETVTEYPNGGMDVQRVVDVLGVQAQEEWVEQVPIQKYIRYTAEELAAQEEARKKAEARDKLPETVAALQAALADADEMNVDQAYRLTLLELNVSDTDDTENT